MKHNDIRARKGEDNIQQAFKKSRFKHSAKNGIVYIVLAFFLCSIGIHNFYAGYLKRGFTQMLLTLSSPFFMFIPLMIVSLWGMGEILFENKSANGEKFGGNRAIILGLRVISVILIVYLFCTRELIL